MGGGVWKEKKRKQYSLMQKQEGMDLRLNTSKSVTDQKQTDSSIPISNLKKKKICLHIQLESIAFLPPSKN